MTKGDKRNKREYVQKQRSKGGVVVGGGVQGGHKSEAKDPASGATLEIQREGAQGQGQGQGEGGGALLQEGMVSQEIQEIHVPTEEAKYRKRNIESNWAKYEIPPSDEEENEPAMTGADFNYVLASAQGAQSHFRLKAEKEWENDSFTLEQLSQEFFSLDLGELERSLACIPLYKQIGVTEDQLEPDLIARFENRATIAREKEVERTHGETRAETEEVTQRLMDLLVDDSTSASFTDPCTTASPPSAVTKVEIEDISKVNIENQMETFKTGQAQLKPGVAEPGQGKEDLDFLSSLLDPGALPGDQAQQQQQQQQQQQTQTALEDEEWLDEFLES